MRITTSGSLGFKREEHTQLFEVLPVVMEEERPVSFRIGGTHSGVTVQAHRTIWWSLQLSPEVAVRLFLSMVECWIRLVASGSRLLYRISFGIPFVLSSDASAE